MLPVKLKTLQYSIWVSFRHFLVVQNSRNRSAMIHTQQANGRRNIFPRLTTIFLFCLTYNSLIYSSADHYGTYIIIVACVMESACQVLWLNVWFSVLTHNHSNLHCMWVWVKEEEIKKQNKKAMDSLCCGGKVIYSTPYTKLQRLTSFIWSNNN